MWTSTHMDALVSWIIESSPKPVLRMKERVRTLPEWMTNNSQELIQGVKEDDWIASFTIMMLSVTNKAMYSQFCRYRIPIYERLGTITYDILHMSFAFAHIHTVVNILFPSRDMEMRRYTRRHMTSCREQDTVPKLISCSEQNTVPKFSHVVYSTSTWKLPGTLRLKKYKVGDHLPAIKAMMGDVFDHGTDDEVGP